MVQLKIDIDALRVTIEERCKNGELYHDFIDDLVKEACDGQNVPGEIFMQIRKTILSPAFVARLDSYRPKPKAQVVVRGAIHRKHK